MSSLRVVLPDQLDRSTIGSIAEARQRVLLAETGYLFTARTHRRKLALLASAGRHFAEDLRSTGATVEQRTIAELAHERPLREHVVEVAGGHDCDEVVVLRPGSWSELAELEAAVEELDVPLRIEEDGHFLTTPAEFADHAAGRKRLVMEYFYREVRRKHAILMDDDKPAGGEWNYDAENRDSFPSDGPEDVPAPPAFEPDETTRGAIADVRDRFQGAPGPVVTDEAVGERAFDLPVTPADAERALDAFVADRLPSFGRYQDAMWSGEGVLYHSHLSPALNLRLLDPRTLISRAETARSEGRVPIAAAEGFIRQVAGWREFMRGVFFHAGPDYPERNELDAHGDLPGFFRTGETRMRCAGDVAARIGETAYAHHIERLMVVGLYAMLAGVDPALVNAWHQEYLLDAYEWVSTPNVIGMSQYADGGLVATKPYAASGKYIERMSNYCDSCRFRPDRATGEEACPFTTLYWDFLARHRERLADNRRMKFQLANLDRKNADELAAITQRAQALREEHAE
jgi:deoxyribodipyrimidine photolyase-related protein